MATFRILHLSDLHIAAESNRIGYLKFGTAWQFGRFPGFHPFSSHDDAALMGLVRHIAALNPRPNLVLATGDLATTGSDPDQAVAAALLLPPRGSATPYPTLANTGIPFAALPGNHDRLGGQLPTRPAVSFRFDHHFQGLWAAGQGAQVMAVLQSGTHCLAVIGADFTFRPGAPELSASGLNQGRIALGGGLASQDTLDALVLLTQQVRAQLGEGTVILWAIHYPPELSDGMPKELQGAPQYLTLIDGDRVSAAAATEGVFAVLCGHIHNNAVFRMSQGPRICVAGSASLYGTRFQNWVHEIVIETSTSTGSTLAVVDHRWNRRSFAWVRSEYSRCA